MKHMLVQAELHHLQHSKRSSGAKYICTPIYITWIHHSDTLVSLISFLSVAGDSDDSSDYCITSRRGVLFPPLAHCGRDFWRNLRSVDLPSRIFMGFCISRRKESCYPCRSHSILHFMYIFEPIRRPYCVMCRTLGETSLSCTEASYIRLSQ